MVLSLCSCAGNNVKTEKVIKIGHHYRPEDDPTYVDDVTGLPVMSESRRRAGLDALETVKEKLGVTIEWVSYPSPVQQCLLQSVLANDPICHIAVLANGTQASVLSQNVLQPIDQYVDFFNSNPEYEWILASECFGHHYLMNRDFLFMNNWPFVYNISMIEAVPSLKRDGKTVYPATLYEEGNWTWSVFRDYIDKIQTYYKGKKAPTGKDIYAFHTNYAHALLFALQSNGASVYDGKNMGFDTEEGIEAAEYMEGLIKDGLLTSLSAGPKSTSPGYLNASDAFKNGETVFTMAARWRMGSCSSALAQRGESMAVIPFPRPDDIKMSDPYKEYGTNRYRIYSAVADSVGVLRGFDEEETRLAIEAYSLYKTEFYKEMGHTDSMLEYKKAAVGGDALGSGIDIFHPEIGDANLRIFDQIGNIPENEFAESMSLITPFCCDIFGASAFGVNGAPSYRINLEASKAKVFDQLESISEALNSSGAVDLMPPSVNKTNDRPIAFEMGTDLKGVNWVDYFKVSDDIDGEYEIKAENGEYLMRGKNDVHGEDEAATFKKDRFSVDFSAVDAAVGAYNDSIVVRATDSSGNRAEKKYPCYIYDGENKVPPTLELNDKERTVGIDVDTSTIRWKDYVKAASDVNGVDLSSRVWADVTMLDVTKKGVYPVVIYVTDFAGNRTEEETEFEVK